MRWANGVKRGRKNMDSEGLAHFIGTWDLVTFSVTAPSGDVSFPLGENAVGQMTYEASGRMSAHLSGSGLKKFASDNTQAATPEETNVAWKGYVGYWGTWHVNGPANVTHHVVGSWFPNWLGTDQSRAYRFDGDRLIIEGELTAGDATLVWKRVPNRV
jgi:hypothetical protein